MADLSDYKIYNNNNFEILTEDGFKDFKGLIVGKNKQKVLLKFSTGDVLKCTPKHKIVISSKMWKYVEDCNVGDTLWNDITIISKDFYENDDPVYEFLDVVNNHTYFVNNILSHQCLIVDECAHIQNDLMEELWKSVIPTISSNKNGEIIVISTPNGADKGNKFYQLYLDAQKENSAWHMEVVNWWDIPGRDEEWKKREIATIGSLHDFQQEYENAFHRPGKSAIDPELLEKLKAQCHDPVLVTDDGAYKIYTLPKPSSFYVVGVDVGEGIGRTNTVAQILDVSDLRNIEQVAVYANNMISPYLFGTRLMGIMNDWGRPPVLIENNSYGQQVLDVLHNTHNYESIVSYRFEGMSKHYDNENRLGIHSHTNTRYKGLTNFRYWVDAIKAVKFNDLDTLIEIAEFVQLPNYTFSKKREEDRDDRIFGLVWGLFVLEPTLAKTYFNITETDDQGRPLHLIPFSDNSDLIKKSPIFSGTVNIYKKEEGTRVPLMFIPQGKDKDPTMDDEAKMLGNWLHRWEPKGKIDGYKQHNPQVIWRSNDVKDKKEAEDDSYRPIVLF